MPFTQENLEKLQSMKSADPEAYSAFLQKSGITEDPLADIAGTPAPATPVVGAEQPAATPTVGDTVAPLIAANPFLASVVPTSGEPGATVDIFDYYQTKLGVELPTEKRNANAIAELIDQYAAVNSERVSLKEIGSKVAIVNENLSKLPPIVQDMITASLANPSEDSIEAMMRDYLDAKAIDFSKPFDKQDPLQMINKFVAESPYASLEDIPEGMLDKFKAGAKQLYNIKQQTLANKPTGNPAAIIGARAESFKQSVVDSVTGLQSLSGVLTQAQINDITTDLYDRGSGVLFNPDGTYTKEAAARLAWAKYGPQWMEKTLADVKQLLVAERQKGREEALSQHMFPHGEQPPRPIGTAPTSLAGGAALQDEIKAAVAKRLGLSTK